MYGAVEMANAVLVSPETGLAIVTGFLAAAACAWAVLRGQLDRRFLLKLFIAALLLRWIVACMVFSKGLQMFFGADAITYDAFGHASCQTWQGNARP